MGEDREGEVILTLWIPRKRLIFRLGRNSPMSAKKFFECCEKGLLGDLREMVESDDFDDKWVTKDHKTGVGVHFSQKFPLYIAVKKNHVNVVKYLLEQFSEKIDVNQQKLIWTGKIGYLSYDNTCLHVCAKEGHVELAKIFLNLPEIKTEVKNHKEKTPLDLAENEEIKTMLRLKQENPRRQITLRTNYVQFTPTKIAEKHVPIVYTKDHNISFFKLEELHPFDSKKFQKIAKFLVEDGVVEDSSCYIKSKIVSDEELRKHHTQEYLDKMKTSLGVAEVIEFYVAAAAPFFIVNTFVVTPMKYQVGGTILAGELAMRYGWAINLGGGMHHCSQREGGGWCAFGDIQLAILNLRRQNLVKKVMIVDLDAHQGNGYERDVREGLIGDALDTYIYDYYVHGHYPNDEHAAGAIDADFHVDRNTTDENYLESVRTTLRESVKTFKPDFMVYNAGTDIMAGDPLGRCSISADGIVERDLIVFDLALEHKVPIMMVTSGGYQKTNGRVIANSIKNLEEKLGLMKIAKCNLL